MQHHQEMGGAAAVVQSRCPSLVDRLLRPMFSLGFSAAHESDSDNILRLKGSTNHDEDEEEEDSECKSFKRSGESINSSCKRRENGVKFCSRGHWKPSEDAKLRELVAAYGPQNWNLIAERLEGRSGKSCRLRWYNQLDPKINKRGFTEEEEERLMEAHRAYGNKWAFISRLFPGRTDNSVKNHWHVLMARRSRERSKSKSYMKMKWASPSPNPNYPNPNHHQQQQQQPPLLETRILSSMQEAAAYNYYGDPHNHGNSYSPVTSQISFAAPISSSTSAADQYRDAAYSYMESNHETPVFIDFLGVGSS